MKTPAMIRGISTAVWLASTLAAFAVQTTTYQVDMSVQITLGNFHPGTDTVFVAGDFSTPNWQSTVADGSTNHILTPSGGNPNIYVGTFTDVHAPAEFENHKFIINPGGNFSALNWENVSGGGNRFFQVPAGATNLPVVFFGDVTNAGSVVTISVTFQINMGVQVALGNFDPANDFVFVAGDAVNNWSQTASQLTQSVSDTNIWTGTFSITSTVGGAVNYKFIMNRFVGGVAWESDGVGPNGAQNRQFVFPNTATNLPVVFFNNITNANSLVVAPITFQVNLIVENALGNFTPGADSVFVAGDAINNWGAGASQLTQSVSDPNVYTGTFNVTNTAGGMVNYKFELNSGVLWESINNRQFVMPSVASNLPSANFNNLADLGLVTISNNASQATVKWAMPGTRIRLQSNTNLTTGTGWQDVPNTLGSNSATVNVSGRSFYRVKGP